MHIHILGICGTFMGSVAQLAKQLGHRVTGCDARVYPPMSDQLESAGIELIEGYDPQQLSPAPDLTLIGNALSAKLDLGTLDLVTSKADVTAEKPDSEVYHVALQRLGLAADEVIAIAPGVLVLVVFLLRAGLGGGAGWDGAGDGGGGEGGGGDGL